MSLESTVISLVPFEIREHKPGLYPPRYIIDPSNYVTELDEKKKLPKVLNISTAYHFVYLDETRGHVRVPNPSDVVAKSVVEDYINSQISIDEDARPALFWIPEKVSAEEAKEKLKTDIAKSLVKQKKWFINVCMLADNDWAKYHQHNVISGFQRKCAEIIGWSAQEHEWMSPHTTMDAKACPACGVTAPKGVIICPNCKLVLDKERAKDFVFANA